MIEVTLTRINMGLEVNKKLLPLKAHYYLFNAGDKLHRIFVKI